VSVLVEEDILVPINSGEIAGVDLGIKSFATVSDGTVFKNPKALLTHERRLKREERAVSRKRKGGNNRKKKAVRREEKQG
jgi:putative transposase